MTATIERRMYNARIFESAHDGRPALRIEPMRSRWALEVARRLLGVEHPALARVLAVENDSYLVEHFGEALAALNRRWQPGEAVEIALSWADLALVLRRVNVVPYLQAPNGCFAGPDGAVKTVQLLRFTVCEGKDKQVVREMEYPTDYALNGWQRALMALMAPSFAVTGRFPESDRWHLEARFIESACCGLSWLILGDWARGRPDPFNAELLAKLPTGQLRTFVDRGLATYDDGPCQTTDAAPFRSLDEFVEALAELHIGTVGIA